MHNERQTASESKVNHRKIKHKLQTLTQKAVMLSKEHNCEILLIIHSQDNNNWLEYCSSEPDRLFFGCKKAKKHLDLIEKYDNCKYTNLLSSVSSKKTSNSPAPAKYAKIEQNLPQFSQPIKFVDKIEDIAKSWKSNKSPISTDFTIPQYPDHIAPIFKDQSKLNAEYFSPPLKKSEIEMDSSPDFDFESYFLEENLVNSH